MSDFLQSMYPEFYSDLADDESIVGVGDPVQPNVSFSDDEYIVSADPWEEPGMFGKGAELVTSAAGQFMSGIAGAERLAVEGVRELGDDSDSFFESLLKRVPGPGDIASLIGLAGTQIPETLESIDQNAEANRQYFDQVSQNARTRAGVDQMGFIGQAAFDGISSAASFAPYLAAGPIGALVGAGATSAGTEFSEGLEKGRDRDEAFNRGLVSGGIEAGFESVPVAAALKRGSPFITRVGKTAGLEALEESANTSANVIADAAFGYELPSLEEFGERQLASTLGGFFGGMTLGGVGQARESLTNYATDRVLKREAEIERRAVEKMAKEQEGKTFGDPLIGLPAPEAPLLLPAPQGSPNLLAVPEKSAITPTQSPIRTEFFPSQMPEKTEPTLLGYGTQELRGKQVRDFQRDVSEALYRDPQAPGRNPILANQLVKPVTVPVARESSVVREINKENAAPEKPFKITEQELERLTREQQSRLRQSESSEQNVKQFLEQTRQNFGEELKVESMAEMTGVNEIDQSLNAEFDAIVEQAAPAETPEIPQPDTGSKALPSINENFTESTEDLEQRYDKNAGVELVDAPEAQGGKRVKKVSGKPKPKPKQRIAPKKAKELKKPVQQTMPGFLDRLNKEQGVFGLHQDIAQGALTGKSYAMRFAENLGHRIDAFIQPNNRRGDLGGREDAFTESDFYGEGYKRINGQMVKIPGLKQWRSLLVLDARLAEKFPGVYKAYDMALDYFADEKVRQWKMWEATRPLFELDQESRERVSLHLRDARLNAERGMEMDESDAALAQAGFTESEIKAIQSVRNTNETLLKPMWKEGLKAKPPSRILNAKASEKTLEFARQKFPGMPEDQLKARADAAQQRAAIRSYEAKVDAFVDGWGSYYVPFVRRGEYYVTLPETYVHPDGRKGGYYMFEKKHKWQQFMKDLHSEGVKDYYYGQIKPSYYDKGDVGFKAVPTEMLAEMAAEFQSEEAENELKLRFEGMKGRIRNNPSITRHLKKARLVPGEELRMVEALSEMYTGVSRYAARQVASQKLDEEIDRLDKQKLNFLADRTRLRRDYIFSSANESSNVRKFLALWNLTKPISALVNGTQPITMLYPELLKYRDANISPEKVLKDAMLTLRDMSKVEALSEKEQADPSYRKPQLNKSEQAIVKRYGKHGYDMLRALKVAKIDGTISAQQADELSAKGFGDKDFDKFNDMALILFRKTEEVNRLLGFAAGFDVAKRRGELDPYTFARRLNNQVNIDYTKASRPIIAQGPIGAPLTTFRLFTAGYLAYLRRAFDDKAWSTILGNLVAMTLLGGIKAFPGVKELWRVAETYGISPTDSIRDNFSEEMGDAILYGLPGWAGYSISGNLASGDLVPEFSRGLPTALGQLFFGALWDIPNRAIRMSDLFERGVNPGERDSPIGVGMRGELLMPPWIQRMLAASRLANSGKLVDRKFQPILKDYTWGEVGFMALVGGSPTRINKAYENIMRVTSEIEGSRDNGNINQRLAEAYIAQDTEGMQALMQEAVANGWQPNRAQVKIHVLKMLHPKEMAVKMAPKKARGRIREIQGQMENPLPAF